MENDEIMIFSHEEFGEIRTIEIDGEIYFVGSDVTKALKYSRTNDAIRKHVEKDDTSKWRIMTQDKNGVYRRREVSLINESGFYCLVLASKLEGAKRFKRWVTHDVIPTIRKTGSYNVRPQQIEEHTTINTKKLELKPETLIINVDSLAPEKLVLKPDKVVVHTEAQTKERRHHLNTELKERLKPMLEGYVQKITSKPRHSSKNQYICPFCNSGTGPKHSGAFTVYNDYSYFCFACNRAGDIFTLYGELHELDNKRDFPQILKGLALEMNVPYDDDTDTAYKDQPRKYETIQPPQKKPTPEPVHGGFTKGEFEKHFIEDMQKKCTANAGNSPYLCSRGIDPNVLKRFKIFDTDGFVHSTTIWNHLDDPQPYITRGIPRVIIPTSPNSIVARAINPPENAQRYLKVGNTHLFNSNGLHGNNIEAQCGYCVIVEGEIDALSAITCGANTVGLGSIAMIQNLFTVPAYRSNIDIDDNVVWILALDNDDAGIKATKDLEALCKHHKQPYIVADSNYLYNGAKDCNEALCKDKATLTARLNEYVQQALAFDKAQYNKDCEELLEKEQAKQGVAKNKLLHFDDTGNAELFASLCQEKARYNCTRNKWMVYQGTHWDFFTEDSGAITNLVKQTLHHMESNILPTYVDTPNENTYLKHIRATRSRRGRDNMLKLSRGELPITPYELDKNGYLFNVLNGTIDLQKCTIRPHNTQDYITKVANVEFDATAKCPLWQKVVSDAMCNDQLLIDYLQRVLGYCLLGANPEECFFIFYGNTTRNGKSTIVTTLSYLMGTGYSVAVSPTTLIDHETHGPNPEVLSIKGARLLTCGELRADSLLNDTFMKLFTGNDTMSARGLYGDMEQFKCVGKLIACTNGLPPLKSNDLIKSGRIHIIPFNRHFDENEQIKDLKDRLVEPQELSGILNWLLDGYKGYIHNGLMPPPIIVDTVKEYQYDNDKIQNFFDECLHKSDGCNTPVSTIYPIYTNWCHISNYKPLGKQLFISKLKERPEYSPKARCRYYKGGEVTKNVIIGYAINADWRYGYGN